MLAERPFYDLLIEGEYCAATPTVHFSYQYVKVIPPGTFVPYKHKEPEGQYLFDHPKDYDDGLTHPIANQ